MVTALAVGLLTTGCQQPNTTASRSTTSGTTTSGTTASGTTTSDTAASGSPASDTTTFHPFGNGPTPPTTCTAPAAASSGNRSVALITAADGTIYYDWWDLGGAVHGFRQVPGDFHTDAAPAATLVNNGSYMFVLAKKPGANATVFLNQGTPGGAWVGWQPMGFTTNLAPAATSSGNRSVALVTAADGTIDYDWWDLGGGGHGLHQVPGGFQTDATPAGALVNNGNYLFVFAKKPGANATVFLNQGTPGGAWVGWQSMGRTTNLAPAAASSGTRSFVFIVAADGQIYYDWWYLGQGGHGFGRVPYYFHGTDTAPAGALVNNGEYLSVLAKEFGCNVNVYVNQGKPDLGFSGWSLLL
jgi:hypothetical protein